MKIEDIEKAAYSYAEENSWYPGETPYECDIVAMKESFAEAFNDGANWRINSVWHEVSEEPERNRIYLAQLGDCAFDTFYDSENWVNFSRGINIQRWAYVEDLLPNKQEEFI